jgi:hypothetical protein
MALWKVKAIKPIDGIDFAGHSTPLPPGRRGYLPQDQALEAARAGAVEMLAPDGLAALKSGGYERRDMQAEKPKARPRPKPKAPEQAKEPEPEEEPPSAA